MEFPSAKCTPLRWRVGEVSAVYKKTLKTVLQNRIVAKEALRTALVEAEGILNSRPVTYVSSDEDDIEALTPNHFLLLRATRVMKRLMLVRERSTQRNFGDSLKRLSTSF